MKGWPVVLALGALGLGFALGRAGVPGATVPGAAPVWRSIVDQAHDDPVPVDPLNSDPREVIPLTPGPGQQPGTGPQQPGQAPGQGECTVLMFKDGQFYRMEPGTAPGGMVPRREVSSTRLTPTAIAVRWASIIPRAR